MWAALRVEIGKLSRQRLPLASLITLAVLTGLMAWGLRSMPVEHMMPGTASGEFILAGKIRTGPLLSYMLLRLPVSLYLLIPLLLAGAAGGLLAGERHVGTLRTLMIRPVSRVGMVGAKLLTVWLYAAVLTFFLGAFALLLGYALFGAGDLLPINFDFGSTNLTILPHGQALGRLLLGYGLAALGMMAVAALGLMFSSFCDNPLTATGLTVAFLMVCGAIQVLPPFESWAPHLLTAHLKVGGMVFAGKIPWGEVGKSLGYLAAYGGVSAVIAGAVFVRRDITC